MLLLWPEHQQQQHQQQQEQERLHDDRPMKPRCRHVDSWRRLNRLSALRMRHLRDVSGALERAPSGGELVLSNRFSRARGALLFAFVLVPLLGVNVPPLKQNHKKTSQHRLLGRISIEPRQLGAVSQPDAARPPRCPAKNLASGPGCRGARNPRSNYSHMSTYVHHLARALLQLWSLDA